MVALLAFVTLAVPIQAGDDIRPVESVSCKETVELPMSPSKRQCPVIELTIKGKNCRFALDTGAEGSRVSQDIVDDLGIKPTGTVQAGDPSGKNSRTVSTYKIPEIDAGSAKLFGVHAFCDGGVVPKGSGAYFDGVLSYAVFKDLLLTIDYPGKKIIVSPGKLSPDQFGRALPFEITHGIMGVDVQVGDVKIKGHFDTGSDGGIMIPAKYKDKLPIVGEPRVIGHGRSLFNEIDIYAADIKGPVTISGRQFTVPTIEMTDLFPNANVGSRFLRNYKVTIDQQQRKMLIEKP